MRTLHARRPKGLGGLVRWLAWLGIGRLIGMAGDGGRLGRLHEGNSDVEREHTVRAKKQYYVGTQISKCRVCAHGLRCHSQKQVLCAYMVVLRK